MRTSTAFLICSVVMLSQTMSTHSAVADSALPTASPTHDAAHTSYHRSVAQHVFALKAIAMAEHEEGETTWLSGPGMLYELTLIPHWLEAEAAAAVLWGKHRNSIPFDLLLKKPFHMGEIVDMYVGFGPAVTLSIKPERAAHVGILASVGSYFWLSKHWGVLAEVDYGYIFEAHGVHEFEAGAGAAWRLY